MTFEKFKQKWAAYQGKEASAYQEHFNDLCRLLGRPTPVEADPSGADSFCFQKYVTKDAELVAITPAGEEAAPEERGFADVWKKDCFGWEYKGKKKNLDEAYAQLLRYRSDLLNPRLLVVCDFHRFIIHTNFNGAAQDTHEFTSDQIDLPENLRRLHACFENPEYLKPQHTTAQVTEDLAETFAKVAQSLQEREAQELADAKTRAEMTFTQRQNLRIARFLNRIVFCFFAEDTGLLPKGLFTDLLKTGIGDLHHFAETLEKLFQVMATGGTFGKDKIRHFNGHLFEEATVFELTADELRLLAAAGEANWQYIQPGIMGTLFERALDFEAGGKLRSQLGAHYTSEADIKALVEPVLMAPLRRDWAALKSELVEAGVRKLKTPGKKSEPPYVGSSRGKLEAFQKKLAALTVLDPACGSGNFLYVALQMLLDLEREVTAFAGQLGLELPPKVSVQQLAAIEINPYAFELAQISVQIGFLQWMKLNGLDNNRSPVLQDLDGFHNEDALLVPHFRSKAKSLKEAQAGEHAADTALKFYTERDWPACDVIVGNPPFLGDKRMRNELGHHYVESLREIYSNRIPGGSDLCCYWFEKARELVTLQKCKRAGLLATNSIRQPRNRKVLERVVEGGTIFFAESDRPWVLDGAAVRVSMIGFDAGSERAKILDGKEVISIDAALSSSRTSTTSQVLTANDGISFVGDCKKGAFDIEDALAIELILATGNPNGLPNSDVVVPLANADDVTDRFRHVWIIDFGELRTETEAAQYERPFAHALAYVKPARDKVRNNLERKRWWLHARPAPDMRKATRQTSSYIATPGVSKHRLFVWLSHPILPAHRLVVFGNSSDFQLGILQSRFHSVWALRLGSTLEDRPCYTPTTCFETFPFPFPDDLQTPTPTLAPAADEPEPLELNGGMANMVARRFLKVQEEPPPYRTGKDGHRAAIAAAAKELNDLRERWLNPPEWTETRVLEFPGTVGGPWDRYLDRSTVRDAGGFQVGTVRYPRLEPRNADFAAKLKDRTLTKLYNERTTKHAWLDFAHQKLDAAVAAAYGWPADLTDEQILERLLALNLERAAEEAKAAQAKPPKAQRTKTSREML